MAATVSIMPALTESVFEAGDRLTGLLGQARQEAEGQRPSARFRPA